MSRQTLRHISPSAEQTSQIQLTKGSQPLAWEPENLAAGECGTSSLLPTVGGPAGQRAWPCMLDQMYRAQS